LGFPSFFSNLQVIRLFWFWQYSWQVIVFVLIYFQYQALVDGMAGQLRSQGASIPEGALFLPQWNPLLLQKQISDLKMTNAGQCLCFFLGFLISLFLTMCPSSTVFVRYGPAVL
jgi:hypothetical protein